MPALQVLLVAALGASAQVEAQEPPPTPPPSRSQGILLDVPVELDGAYLGEIVVRIDGEAASVRTEDLIPLLDDILEGAAIDLVASLPTDGEGFVSARAISEAGLPIAFEADRLALNVSPSIAQRGTRQLSLRPQNSIDPASAIQPQGFSAGVTSIVRVANIHAQPGAGANWEPLRAEFFGFASLGGFDSWTLLWAADFDGGRDSRLRRREVALVRDNFEAATRLTLGDFRTRPLSGFQRSIDMVGVSYRRAYAAIQPFRTLLPRGRSSFTLERQARVRVEVEGLVVFDQDLPPGPYDLRDFPFATGANNAVVTVDDGSGPREIAYLTNFIDTSLIADGLSRFDIGVGFLGNGFSAAQRYRDEPALVASYDRGISSNLTVGGYAELSGDVAVAGARGAWGTRFGLISGEAAMSRTDSGWGLSAAIQFRTQFETGKWRHNLAAQAVWRNDHFTTLSAAQDRERSFDLRVQSQRRRLILNLDASRRTGPFDTTKSVAVGAGWEMFGLSWRARGQFVRRTGRPDDHRGVLSVSIPLGRSTRSRARVGTDGDFRLEVQRLGGFTVGETQARAEIMRNDDGFFGGSARVSHIANRAEFEFDHQTRDTPNGLFSRSEATVAFGVGYADGEVQFGRPFDAGFVIVDRHPNIAKKRASLSEGGRGEAAHSDIFGAPFIPLRSGYARYTYNVAVDELDPGYDLGEDRIEVIPPLRGGYTVRVGTDILATVLARLTDPAGEPVALATGRIIRVANGEQVGRFFTNRTGRMVAEKLAPGDYRIVLDNGAGDSAILRLEEGETGIIDRGIINLGGSQ